MYFTKNSFYEKTFSNITLEKEVVKNIEFEDCRFKNCSFVDCTFIKCKFIGCKFDSCGISAVIPTDSTFVDVKFSNGKTIGFDWTKAQRVANVNFENCQINYSNFRMLKLQKIKMIACEAKEVDFTNSDFTEGVFTGTDFERSIFSKTILTKADFVGAKNYYIDVRNNSIKNARFSLPEALSLISSLEVIIE